MALTRRGILLSSGVAALASQAGLALPAAAKPVMQSAKPIFGPAPGLALLSRNENPFGPSKTAVRAISDVALKGAYYAENGINTLRAMIAERHNLTPDHIVISTGSGEVLSAIALAWGESGTILTPDLFWATTVKYAQAKGAKVKSVPMKPGDLSYSLEDMAANVDDSTSLVHITNPNNPTGQTFDGNELRAFCRKIAPKATILLDEAYNELTDKPDYTSMVDLVREGENIIIARTFSKIYGMAGLRIGYAIAQPDVAKKIASYVMSWPNAAGLAGAIASYNDEAFLAYSKSKILEGREMILEAVKTAGLRALPSQTNFVFVDVGGDANIVRQKMMDDHNVSIRGVYGQYTNYSRVSTGFLEDVERYCKALPKVVSA